MAATKPATRPENYITKTRTCWAWTGPFASNGEPLYVTQRGSKRARNVMYEKHVRELPSSALLSPKCGHDWCVCPAHQKVVKV